VNFKQIRSNKTTGFYLGSCLSVLKHWLFAVSIF